MSKKQRKKSVKAKRKKNYTVSPAINPRDPHPLMTTTPQTKLTRKRNGN